MANASGAPASNDPNVWAGPPYHQRWLFALKPASFPKLLVPMVFGQALGVSSGAAISPLAVFVCILFTLFDLGFIVLLNDWADRDVDTIKRRMFPQAGSPKTIVDGILPARSVLLGALGSGALAIMTAEVGGRALARPWLGLSGIACVLLFVAYSLPPLRLNYRGGGEVLEALGVGLALPVFCIYAHAGRLFVSGMDLLPGLVAMSLASAVASGLADEESDRVGGKTTIASAFGNGAARRVAEGSLVAGAVLWIVVGLLGPGRILWSGLVAAAFVLARFTQVRALSARATTNAFAAHRAYKSKLHRAIWEGTLALAILYGLGF